MNIFKYIWLKGFKTYLSLGMFFYYKKIKVFNIENIPLSEPVLILSNHQNALLDALLIATKSPRFVYFLTRASVFNKPWAKKFLMSLQMMPVYRIRDGWNNLSKNTEIFETCAKLLKNKEALVIFPEGNHNLKRVVRPLSKGFTRIVFETLQQNPNIQLKLLPVGLNFKHATNFKDSVSIYFGEPFLANDFLGENGHKSTIKLKQTIQSKISDLTTHIPLDEYDDTLNKLKELNVNFLNPNEVNTCIASDFSECFTKPKKNFYVNNFFKSLLITILFVPYMVWKLYVQPKIAEKEFIGTFRFAIAITLVPIWLIIITTLLSVFLGFAFGVGFLLFALLIALLAVKL